MSFHDICLLETTRISGNAPFIILRYKRIAFVSIFIDGIWDTSCGNKSFYDMRWIILKLSCVWKESFELINIFLFRESFLFMMESCFEKGNVYKQNIFVC